MSDQFNQSQPGTGNDKRKDNVSYMSEVRRFTNKELDKLKVLYPEAENTALLKTFRDLRTRIYKHAQGQNFVCMVTSVVPQGGASHVVANLGAAIALDKTKTSVLVDCNLYSPSLETFLAIGSHAGLTDFLDDKRMTVDQIVYASGLPRTRVIPVGNNCDGGTEKITSRRMKSFLHEVKSRYMDRFVIIDAPPVGDYDAEVRILADLSDFVLLVVPYGKVTAEQVENAIAVVGKERLAGLVFNNS